MSAHSASSYLQHLHRQKQQVEQEIHQLQAHLRTAIESNPDEGDPALLTQTVTQTLLRNARRKLAAIEHALAQAQRGRYGMCEVCGQPINPERLAILPQATLCVPCQTKRERKR
jgi:DnaK suppressor protein